MTWLDGSWDFLRLDGERLPGRCRKLDVEPTRDVKTTLSPGFDGPEVKDQGYTGSTVDIEIECWRAVQAEALMSRLSVISPQQLGGDTNPHAIDHPITAAANISKIYIISYHIGMPSGGLWVLAIKAAQWFAKPKKTGGTAKVVPADGGPLFNPNVPAPDPKNNGAHFP